MSTSPKAIALFSGGLDSILAAKLVQQQGIDVQCLHFHSPFFGKVHLIPHWEKVYGLSIRPVDISHEFVQLLVQRPTYGFGSSMNPCVDCKIIMMQKTLEVMQQENACCIISGEVLGQRPMSQRRETLNIIRRDAKAQPYLLRPLSALLLDPTQAELDGIIQRDKLAGLSGRGRKGQMELAKQLALKEIPTPAGGCRLTEQENVRSYWPVLQYFAKPAVSDFYLANHGRQLWHFSPDPFWLVIGRDKNDNEAILQLAQPDDIIFKIHTVAGPIALARKVFAPWNDKLLEHAASIMAGYSNKAMQYAQTNNGQVQVALHKQSIGEKPTTVTVTPNKVSTLFTEFSLDVAQAALKEEARQRALQEG